MDLTPMACPAFACLVLPCPALPYPALSSVKSISAQSAYSHEHESLGSMLELLACLCFGGNPQ